MAVDPHAAAIWLRARADESTNDGVRDQGGLGDGGDPDRPKPAVNEGSDYDTLTFDRPPVEPSVQWSGGPTGSLPPIGAVGDDVGEAANEAGTMGVDVASARFDTEALRETVQLSANDLDRLGVDFYAQLFARNPELRDMFPAGMEVQRSRLVGALVRIVGAARDPAQLSSYLKGLGRDHRKFGVITAHYASIGSALVLAMRNLLGERWTPRHESAWVAAYDEIARIMVDGAAEDAVLSPPWWDAEVIYHHRVLDDIAIIQVRPHTRYPYRPGQYCWVTTPRRPKMWRPYSMATNQRDDGLLEFHVRAVKAGWVSSALVWRTEPGDILHLGAPLGTDLAWPRADRDLLCVCAGTGIAPVLAGLQELEQRQDGRQVHVFYAGRNRSRLYGLPHLESIGTRYRDLTLVPVVSPQGPKDRSPDILSNVVASYGDWSQHQVYCAGPSEIVQTTVDRLRNQGLAEQQVIFDDYGIW